MSFRFKLVILIVFVVLVPLLVSAFTTFNIHEKAFEAKVTELHRTSAQSGAALVQIQLKDAETTISLAINSIKWPELSAAEQDGALWLVYRQLSDIAVVSLLDENGQGIGPSVYQDRETADQKLAFHPTMDLPLLEAFAQEIPFEQAQTNQVATGRAFIASGIPMPIIPLGVSVPGKKPGTRWVLAIGFSLRSVCREVIKMGAYQTRVYLADPENRIVCRSHGGIPLSPLDQALQDKTSIKEPTDVRYRRSDGEEMLAHIAPTPRGWVIVASQPESVAFASSRFIRLQTVFWIILSVLAAAIAGRVIGTRILAPVGELVKGADELARGNFNYRLNITGNDEFGKLSSSFNHMGEEVEKRDAEIRQWNKELQNRVNVQTTALKSVQDQLLQSQKIAAVTSLGAGVAHEINNPLTAVLGLTQIMIASADDDDSLKPHKPLLQSVEKEALRIKDIVGTLQSFTENFAGEGFSTFKLHQFIDETVAFEEPFLEESNITVEKNYANLPLSIHGNQTQMRQVFTELFKNARIAMPEGGQVRITTTPVGERALQIIVSDTGRGIEEKNLDQIFEPFFTTKDDWQSEGLGLTIAFRIIEEHHGSIRADNEPGGGAKMTITLPAAKGGAHIV